jgi:hypothetical protein
MVAQASRVFAGLPASAEAFRSLLSRAARCANPRAGRGLRTTAHNAYRANRAARSEKGLLLLLQSLIASNL